jgi:branched-subunit amino acid aminotransferase/4-amino-4-deoxychorismate lyase
MYEEGASAMVAEIRRNETSPLSRVKSLNYLDNVLARETAQRDGAYDALLLNTTGLLAEASAANVFVVREGALVTPPLQDGPLPGITREAVLEIASEAGIPPTETSVALRDLQTADEAFLTNAVAGVMPLVTVDGAPIADGLPGATTRRLRSLYVAAAEGA